MALTAFKVNMGRWARPLAALLAVLCLFNLSAWAAEPFTVQPVEKPQQLRLLPASAWPPAESDHGEMLLKLSYLRGLIDALQYVELSPQSSGQVLAGLKGLGLNELAAAVDLYYLKDPRRRELPPAAVLFRLLPDLRGKPDSPLPK